MSGFFFVLFCLFFGALFVEVTALDSADSSSKLQRSTEMFTKYQDFLVLSTTSDDFLVCFVMSSWNVSRYISELRLKMCLIKPHFILNTFTCCLITITLTVSRFLADNHHHALTHGEVGRSLTGCPDRSLSHKGHSLASLWQRVVLLSEQLLSKTIGQ